jgi:Calcineurin-like phosphoesterase
MNQEKKAFRYTLASIFVLSMVVFVMMVVGLGGCGKSSSNDPASPAAPTVMFKFAVTDDSRAASGPTGTKNGDSNGAAALVVNTIAKDIAAQNAVSPIDFVLFPGDMVSGYTTSTALSSELDTWVTAMKPVSDAKIPLYTTRGNHEYDDLGPGAANPDDPSRATYLAHFVMPTNGPTTSPTTSLSEVGLTWSFTHKNAKFIGFDMYSGRTVSFDNTKYAAGSNKGQMMNPWVLSEVNNSTSGVLFVMAHEMMWPTLSHQDCMANDPDSRDALVHAMGAHNGTYFAGHNHLYIRGVMNNDKGDKVPAFTVGTGGGGNYDFTVGDFDPVAKGYAGPDSYTVQKSYANSKNPYFGYVLVTVYSDNTWKAEFRGFQFNSWNSTATPADLSVTPVTVMDSVTSSSMLK